MFRMLGMVTHTTVPQVKEKSNNFENGLDASTPTHSEDESKAVLKQEALGWLAKETLK